MEFKTIVSAILVIAVVIFAIFLLQRGWPLIQSILGFGEEVQETLETKETIKDRFNDLVNIYTNCINSEKVNCVCTKDKIIRFPSEYNIRIQEKIISLLQKDKELYTSEFSSILNCFTSSDKDVNGIYKSIKDDTILLEPSIIFFDDPKSSYVKKGGFGPYNIVEDAPWSYKHSKNEICLVTEWGLSKAWIFDLGIPEKRAKQELNSLQAC